MLLRRRRPLVVASIAALAVCVPLSAEADTVLSRSDAEAVSVSVAGNAQGSGPVEATYDGEETVTGEIAPPAAPFSQQFVTLGVLTQQARAGNGFSRACAGVAGNGGGIVQIGEGSCLTQGARVTGSLADLSLEGLGLAAPGAGELPVPGLPGLPAIPGVPGGGLPTGGLEELDGIIQQALAPLAEQLGGLTLGFDAIEARCEIDGGAPTGSAALANAAVVAQAGGREVKLVQLPANPAPNTEVVTDLSEVIDILLGGVETQLNSGLDGATGPLAPVVSQIRAQVVAGVRDNLEEQLAPLEENVLRIVLNEQSATADSIDVTAMRVEVLPAAAAVAGSSLIDARIGTVGCGPADRAVEAAEDPEPEAAPPAPEQPRLPTEVSAGVAGQGGGSGPGAAAYGVLALGTAAAGAAGWSAWRRRSALRG